MHGFYQTFEVSVQNEKIKTNKNNMNEKKRHRIEENLKTNSQQFITIFRVKIL